MLGEKPGCVAYLCTAFGWTGAAFVVLVAAGEGSSWMVIGSVLFYAVYSVEGLLLNKLILYYSNVLGELELTRYIEKMQDAPPVFKWSIHCWHTEEEIRERIGGGKVHTYKVMLEKTTRNQSFDYPVGHFIDETLGPLQTLTMIHLRKSGTHHVQNFHKLDIPQPNAMILLCHFPLVLHPADQEAEDDFRQTRNWFLRDTDKHNETSEEQYVNGHMKRAMVVLRGSEYFAKLPCWTSYVLFFFCTVLLMSLPYRLFVFCRCHHVNWEILKHFTHESSLSWPPEQSRRHRSDVASIAFRAVPQKGTQFIVPPKPVPPEPVPPEQVPPEPVGNAQVSPKQESNPEQEDNNCDTPRLLQAAF